MGVDNIPKLKIEKIGSFNSGGMPIDWRFGKALDDPNSIGVYWDEDVAKRRFGGYSIIELIKIKELNQTEE